MFLMTDATSLLEVIRQPWHWSVSGAMIALIMFLLLWFGRRFGVSSNLETICSILSGGKKSNFFDVNWRAQTWNLVFIGGAIIGGYIASHFLASPEPVQISEQTVSYLTSIGIQTPQTLAEGTGYLPQEIFASKNLFSISNLIIIIVGGFFIGFGTRWASGCTSGHAISGLANLQLPSLIAVIGFFIGGLLMSWLILPHIINL